MGDALMATSQVKQMHKANGRPVHVVGRGGKPQWSEIFENNPRIARRRTLDCQLLLNASGVRPYIRDKTVTRWYWKRWDITPGEIYLSKEETMFGEQHAGRVFVEPSTKVPNGNKAWPWDRWQAFVHDSDRTGGTFVQCCPTLAGPWLDGVLRVITPTFRLACAVLSQSRAFVGTEGGLHHAAAALNIPAVVLFSEFIGPEITGYSSQRNIRHANGMCGSRFPCPTCKASMEAITVDEVRSNVAEAIG